jgi:hypothetical protein
MVSAPLEVTVAEELIAFASKQDMLAKSKQFWNPDKTQFWIDSGVPLVIDRVGTEGISASELLVDPAGVPRARAMLQRAEWAARAFARYDKDSVDTIVRAAAAAGAAKARERLAYNSDRAEAFGDFTGLVPWQAHAGPVPPYPVASNQRHGRHGNGDGGSRVSASRCWSPKGRSRPPGSPASRRRSTR